VPNAVPGSVSSASLDPRPALTRRCREIRHCVSSMFSLPTDLMRGPSPKVAAREILGFFGVDVGVRMPQPLGKPLSQAGAYTRSHFSST